MNIPVPPKPTYSKEALMLLVVQTKLVSGHLPEARDTMDFWLAVLRKPDQLVVDPEDMRQSFIRRGWLPRPETQGS